MQMKVENHLTSTPLNIEEQLIARLGNPLFHRHFPGPQDHLTNDILILLRKIVETSDMVLGHDKKMDRGMGMNILKNDNVFVLI